MLKILSFFFICILTGCGNSVSQNGDTTSQNQNQQSKTTNQVKQKAAAELTLKMERFSWTGKTIYKLEIQPDGKIIFEGTDYTKTKAKVQSKLNKEKLKQLIEEIENATFFSLNDRYDYESNKCPITWSDSPQVKIAIKLNGKEKNIFHGLGCQYDLQNDERMNMDDLNESIFPQQLYKLENKIDLIAETKRWAGEKAINATTPYKDNS